MTVLYTLYGLAVGLVFFLCSLKAYTLGLQHGKELSKGITPSVNINPVKAVREFKREVQQEQQSDKISEGLHNLFSYTGDPQKREGEE
jgi:hypothetical protein